MPRLIDADKLTAHKYSGVDFTKFADKGWHKSDEEIYAFKCGWNEALSMVSNHVSTVDAETVVRCQDCESWGLNVIKTDEKGEKAYGDCLHFCLATPKWFYCAWGERKNGQRVDESIDK